MISFPLMIFCLMLAFLPFTLALGAVIVGRVRLARATKPVSYYPPRGYSPIDVWSKYYGKRGDAHALINPLMLYWADRGFITIEEDCKRGLKLTKLKDLTLPDNITEITNEQCRNFDAEEDLFKKLFAGGRKNFYTLAASADHNEDIKKFMTACTDSVKRSDGAKRANLIRRLCFALAVITAVLNTAIVGLTVGGEVCMMSIFPLVGMIMYHFVPSEDIMKFLRLPFFAVWGGVPFTALLTFLPTDGMIVMLCAVLASAVTINVLYDRIDLRSDGDIALYGEICAFKTFLLEAELDRLETLIEENPNYFYDILPFCYILKITHKLRQKFDRITLDGPSWYLGDLRNTLMF